MQIFLRRLIYALLLAVVVYGVFVVSTGLESLQQALSDFAWWSFGLAILLSSFNYFLRYLKWEFYLKTLKISGVPKGESALVFLSGFALTVTPGKLGEMFKSAVLKETHGVPAARTAPIVLAERLTDVISIVGLVLLGSTGFEGGLFWAMLGAACVLAGLALIRAESLVHRLLDGAARRSRKMSGVTDSLRTSYQSLRLMTETRVLLVPTLLSFVGWLTEGSGLYFLLKGFGSPVALDVALFFYATSMLAGALIPVPGGLGVTEGMLQGQLVQLGGASASAATGAMLLLRFATLWWAVLLGFTALFILKRLFPELLSSKKEASASS